MKRPVTFIFTLLMLLGLAVPAAAAEGVNAPTVVRVGFPIQTGLTELDSSGEAVGYTVDYLDEISKYTNWEYEFVQVEGDINQQLLTLLGMLQRGEIDLMGAMNYNNATAEMFLFPEYSYGSAYTVLSVREDDLRFIENDHQTLNNIRIGTCSDMSNRLASLEQYAAIYDFDYTLVDFPNADAMAQAVLDKRVDACLQLDLNLTPGLRSIARFDPRPYYFALAPDEQDLLQPLNDAIYNLTQTYSHLQTELYNRYFRGQVRFQISSANAVYISNLRPLRVLFFDGCAPLQYVRDGEVQGVARSFIDQMCSTIGLEYKPLVAQTYEEGLELVQNGEVDIVACLARNTALAAAGGLKLSMPYMDSHSVLVFNENASDTGDNSPQFFTINTETWLREMNKLPDSSAYLDSYVVSFYLRKAEIFRHVDVNWSDIRTISYSLGLSSNVGDRLVGILNNYITSLDDDAVYEMIYTGSHAPVEYTAGEWLFSYRYQLTTVVIALAMAIYLSFRARARVKNRIHQQENDRFSHLAQLFRDCLFEYSYERDELVIQNNHILFQGESVIKHLSRLDPSTIDENAQRYHPKLMQVFREKLPSAEFALVTEQGNEWCRVETEFTDSHGSAYAMGRISNITQEAFAKQQELEEHANFDQLTGLYNRYIIEQRVERHLDQEEPKGIFLLMDIDNFKKVNDIHGHIEGDALLRRFAEQLSATFRTNDLKGRIGGDEFIVFIPNNIDEAALQDKLQHLMTALHQGPFARYQDCNVSVSIGAAYLDGSIRTYNAIYRKADGAMYEAKGHGKNDYRIVR